MIKECNFKSGSTKDKNNFCMLKQTGTCNGEEKCVLFQIYKETQPVLNYIADAQDKQNKRMKKWADDVAKRSRKIF